MRRGWIVGIVLLTAACGTSNETFVCGACPGSSFAMNGLPELHGPTVIRACVAGSPCQSTQVPDPRHLQGLQYVALPTGQQWAAYDGTAVQVSLRTSQGRWQGAGTFDYTPADGSPCDCGGLVASVSMQPTSPRG